MTLIANISKFTALISISDSVVSLLQLSNDLTESAIDFVNGWMLAYHMHSGF